MRKKPADIRIGYGYDIHPLIPGSEGLWLGGIHIVFNKNIHAHSDGDVLLHSVCDALLGASCLGDIGEHFPDSDDEWHKIASSALVSRTLSLLSKNDFHIINLDTTILLQQPSLAPYKKKIAANLANLVQCNSINIKATTGEGLDAVGRGEAIAAHCVCLLGTEERR